MGTTGELEIKTFCFTWKVKDFSKKGEKVGDAIFSPIFQIEGTMESEWRLILYPHGETEKSKDYLSLFLQSISVELENSCLLKTYAFKLSFLDTDGNKRHQLCTKLVEFELHSWGWCQFCKRDSLIAEKNLLIDDTLNIYCCMTLNLYSTEELKRKETMLSHYEALYSNATFSDLTIVIQGKEIKANKNILSARSKVFAAMFEHDMKEKNTDTLEIDDISYGVMEELLRFLYCGKVQSIKKLAKPLLIAADKYDVSSLKAMCERTLFENLEVENACDVLIVADCYNCEKLKSETIDFIIKNIKAVTTTSKFKELKINNAELLEAILCKIGMDN